MNAKILAAGDARHGLDLETLSRTKGWRHQRPNPLKVDALSPYVLSMWNIIVKTLERGENLAEAKTALETLQDIKQGFSKGKWLKVAGLYEIPLDAQRELSVLLGKKFRGEAALWFNHLIDQLPDAEERLQELEEEELSGEVREFLHELGLNYYQGMEICDQHEKFAILEAIDYIEFECDHRLPHIIEVNQQNLMLILVGIFGLYSHLEVSALASLAKQALQNAEFKHPRDFGVGQAWSEGAEFDNAELLDILKAAKDILAAIYAH